MIELHQISFEELKPLVELGFGGDTDLMQIYEPVKSDFPTMVQRNLDNVNDARPVFDLKPYKVKCDGEDIGFTVVGKKIGILSSFGINMKWRRKEIVMAWFHKVSELLNHKIICVLNIQNTRAIKFLTKQGMVVSHVNSETATLRTKKD